ncbi:MAG: HNH endonuclease, partial [Victivallales bacterium]|nr:HNH endonuclease [Victivallales bacterium]
MFGTKKKVADLDLLIHLINKNRKKRANRSTRKYYDHVPLTRRCKNCGQDLPEEVFKTGKSYRRICRKCQAIKAKEKYRAKVRVIKKKKGLTFFPDVSPGTCHICGVIHPDADFSFSHGQYDKTCLSCKAKKSGRIYDPSKRKPIRLFSVLPGFKYCPGCLQVLDIKDFNDAPYRKGGKKEYCKYCHRSHNILRRNKLKTLSDKTLNGLEIRKIKSRKTCIYCGEKFSNNQALDHMDPISKGGSHSVSNLIASCIKCNSKKKDKPFIKFIKTIPENRQAIALKTYIKKKGNTPEQKTIFDS